MDEVPIDLFRCVIFFLIAFVLVFTLLNVVLVYFNDFGVPKVGVDIVDDGEYL